MLPENATALCVTGINPVQWKEPNHGVARGPKGRQYVSSWKNAEMQAYQLALCEAIVDADPDRQFPIYESGDLIVDFFFWRNLERTISPRTGRATSKRRADRTNLLKSTEDALQGILYANDSQIIGGEAIVVAQGHDVAPAVVVIVRPATDERPTDLDPSLLFSADQNADGISVALTVGSEIK
jgi:Holliday junction resolvase RusA-like endonuclease